MYEYDGEYLQIWAKWSAQSTHEEWGPNMMGWYYQVDEMNEMTSLAHTIR